MTNRNSMLAAAAKSADDFAAVPAIRPAFCSIDTWKLLSGMSRRVTYAEIANGHLRAIKRGSSTLIDCEAGLEWLRSLPLAKIRPEPPRKAAGSPRKHPAPEAAAAGD